MIRVSVPGSIMLLGEHAVLYGYRAVVAAINRRLTVSLVPRQDSQIIIRSNNIGVYKTSLTDLSVERPFRFVLAAIQRFQNELTAGFELNIETEFSDKVGLGSSAAVTTATIAVLLKYLKHDDSLNNIYRLGVEVIHVVQGVGSGADVAASVFGGVLSYCVNPVEIKPLQHFPQITLIYVGYKTPTIDVVKKVRLFREEQQKVCDDLFLEIGHCVDAGIAAFNQANWLRLGEIFSLHQSYQEQLGVSDKTIECIIHRLKKIPVILGAKISGSGLGDCVVALGTVDSTLFHDMKGIQIIPVTVTSEGVRNEST